MDLYKRKRFLVFMLQVILFLNLTKCNQEEKDKNFILIGGLLYLHNQLDDYNCKTSPSPVSFTDFKTAIENLTTSSKCTECHGVNTAQSNFIILNYSSVTERINVGSPKTSILYLKVKPGGAMNVYSNAQVNQAIYCWIANGANP